jgi:hypothetical protein
MLLHLLNFLRPVRFYALLLVGPLAWFAWGSYTGTRLLGDDNETTEALNGPAGRTGGSSGHAHFFHK